MSRFCVTWAVNKKGSERLWNASADSIGNSRKVLHFQMFLKQCGDALRTQSRRRDAMRLRNQQQKILHTPNIHLW